MTQPQCQNKQAPDLPAQGIGGDTRIDDTHENRGCRGQSPVCASDAKNRQMETDATEIRIRAERRLGEMLAETPKQKGESGGRPRNDGKPSAKKEPGSLPPTLADMGIDKKLSARSQKLAAVSIKHRRLFARAWDGSRKAAIRAFCLDCCGFSPREVRRCSNSACTLFEFRVEG